MKPTSRSTAVLAAAAPHVSESNSWSDFCNRPFDRARSTCVRSSASNRFRPQKAADTWRRVPEDCSPDRRREYERKGRSASSMADCSTSLQSSRNIPGLTISTTPVAAAITRRTNRSSSGRPSSVRRSSTLLRCSATRRYLDVADSACRWILALPREQTDTGTLHQLSQSRSELDSQCQHARRGAAGAHVAAHAESLSTWISASAAMEYSCTRQLADGAWWYGEEPEYHWIDNFHTGYNLTA